MLLTISQAAARIPCSERWLADNLRAGKFPAHRLGRKWMLSDEDIAAILAVCSVTPTTAGLPAAPSSSMTKTTLRRLQQTSRPR